MFAIVTAFVKNYWATLATGGALLAACLVCIRDWFTIRKLQLEISQLRDAKVQRDARIVMATMEQIEKYASNPPLVLRSHLLGVSSIIIVLMVYLLGIGLLFVLGFARFAAMLGLAGVVYLISRWFIKRLVLMRVADELQLNLAKLEGSEVDGGEEHPANLLAWTVSAPKERAQRHC